MFNNRVLHGWVTKKMAQMWIFYPFRFHSLGHKVIYMHGPHPLANGGTGFGNLGNGGWLEFLIIYVGLD